MRMIKTLIVAIFHVSLNYLSINNALFVGGRWKTMDCGHFDNILPKNAPISPLSSSAMLRRVGHRQMPSNIKYQIFLSQEFAWQSQSNISSKCNTPSQSERSIQVM